MKWHATSALCLSGALVLATATAAAQTPAAAAPTSEDDAARAEHPAPGSASTELDERPEGSEAALDDAVAAFQAGRWADARDAFALAHALAPSARALRGLGMAHFELEEYVDAAIAFESALRETRRSLTERQRSHARSLLEQCYRFVARYTLEPGPSTATMLLDGAPARLSGSWPENEATLIVSPGRHDLTVRLSAQREVSRELDAIAGRHQPLILDLHIGPDVDGPTDGANLGSLPSETTETPSSATADTPLTDGAEETRAAPAADVMASQVVATRWLVGAGTGALVVGLGLLGAGVARGRGVEDAPHGTEWSSLSRRFERSPRLVRGGWAIVGAGAALALVGLVLHARGSDARDERQTPHLALTASGIRLRW